MGEALGYEFASQSFIHQGILSDLEVCVAARCSNTYKSQSFIHQGILSDANMVDIISP
jgi:hypothetical protein